MKTTIKGFKAYTSKEVANLINPVKNQLGENAAQFFETCGYVSKSGADSGFSGFIYYADTIAFFRKHRKNIVALAEYLADEMGDDAVTMVKNFRCLNGLYEYSDIAKAMYGNFNDEYTTIYNALSWFALEEVANEAVNYLYENE